MFGPPCIIPPGGILLRQVWTYVIKHYGKRKSRNTCDGYPLPVKGIKYYKKLFSLCLPTRIQHFLALSTALGYVLMESDAINTYGKAPPPDEPLYVHVDYQYRNWYYANNGI